MARRGAKYMKLTSTCSDVVTSVKPERRYRSPRDRPNMAFFRKSSVPSTTEDRTVLSGEDLSDGDDSPPDRADSVVAMRVAVHARCRMY
jgi:hypothetical protein